MPRPVPILAGDLITLRPLDPARDAADYYTMNLDPEVHTWTGNHLLASVAEAQAELERFAAMEDLTTWAIIDNASGQLVGRFFICLQNRGGRLIAGEGNRIARPFWRKGHNREARELIFHYIFETLGADWIETECWKDNVNSRLSILAHGFDLIAEAQEFNPKHQKLLTKCTFRLRADHWRQTTDSD